jgi:salicylate hydroxylase
LTGQGACQAIESGFALAQVLKNWKSTDVASAFQIFHDFRKPRTDRITRTSAETGKMASAAIPEELWATTFRPNAIQERMRWVMEYDLLGELAAKLKGVEEYASSKEGEEATSVATQASAAAA